MKRVRALSDVRLCRRDLLRGSAAAALLGWRPAPLGALPRRPVAARTLVLVFVRGGLDGLNLLVPHGDPHYHALRPTIGVPPPGAEGGALPIDELYGLHPAAAPLLPWLQSGAGTFVQGVGRAGNTRSHFAEQDAWETCVAKPGSLTGGWLNRHLATSAGRGPVRAVALGLTLPRALRGDASAVALRELDDLTAGGAAAALARYEAELGAAHSLDDETRGAEAELARSGRDALAALDELARVAAVRNAPDVVYPSAPIGRYMADVARIVRADIGVELVTVDSEGWDTHDLQGGSTGVYASRLAELSGALGAFCRELGPELERVLVLLVSEFGRTAAENGTRGTDHGQGNCALALGGPVFARSGGRARPVLGAWPGLAPEQLFEGRDLAHAIDFRDVYAEVLRELLGNPHADVVLPGHEVRALGLV